MIELIGNGKWDIVCDCFACALLVTPVSERVIFPISAERQGVCRRALAVALRQGWFRVCAVACFHDLRPRSS